VTIKKEQRKYIETKVQVFLVVNGVKPKRTQAY